MFRYLRYSQRLPYNVDCLTREPLVRFLFLMFWYDAVLYRGLNPGPPALKASTLPLIYRGGGALCSDHVLRLFYKCESCPSF
mgnify:CR=1 FL=1